MTQQFGRKVSLIVGDAAGNGLDLSDMHIKFETHRGDIQTPNWASIRVYNLSEATTKALQTKEYTTVTLKAGYEGNFGIIFKGTLKYKYRGHESNIDSYLDLIVADGDSAYNFAVVNTTLAAGSRPKDHLAAIAKATEAYGVLAAPTQPPLNTTTLPRGKVMFAPAKDCMRVLADSNGATWSIQDGQLQLILQTAYLPGDPIVIRSDNGLIGFPEQTLNGLIVRTLLNPSLKIGTRIKIDNANVQQFQFDINFANAQLQKTFLDNMKDDDGEYKVLVVEHAGDTRGNTYYSRLVCIGVNTAVQPSSSAFYKSSVNAYGS